jgi:hypothetical protein
MRFYELFEASVLSKPEKYVPGYKLRIAVSSQTGKAIFELLAAQIRDLQPAEIFTIADSSEQAEISADLPGKGGAVFKIKRANGQILQIVGSPSSIQAGFNDAGAAQREDVKINLGDTAEGILGAATFAKLVNRQSNQVGLITAQDVFDIFDKLKPYSSEGEADTWFMTAADLDKEHSDKIWFRCKIKAAAKFAITDPKLRAKITPLARGAAAFMNSPYGQRYADYWYKNNQSDEVGVVSDGLSAQSEQKTDVFMLTREEDGALIKQRLPISLKAGAAQFAQESGLEPEKLIKLFAPLGVEFPADMIATYRTAGKTATHDTQLANVAPMYEFAARVLDNNLKALDDQGEYQFLNQLGDQIERWATLGDSRVRLVNFKGSKFEVLSFANLRSKLKKITLRAEYVFEANPIIRIVGVDKSGKEDLLIKIRTYLNDKGGGKFYQRNIIEKGPLLSKVAQVTKF